MPFDYLMYRLYALAGVAIVSVIVIMVAAGTGYDFYRWLRKHSYPKGNFRLLCFNCNCGRELNGGICPHCS